MLVFRGIEMTSCYIWDVISAVRCGVEVLPHSLKEVVFANGSVHCQILSELLLVQFPLKVSVRNVRFMCVELFVRHEYGEEYSVLVECGELRSGGGLAKTFGEHYKRTGNVPDYEKNAWNIVLDLVVDALGRRPLGDADKTWLQENIDFDFRGSDADQTTKILKGMDYQFYQPTLNDDRHLQVEKLRTSTQHFLKLIYNPAEKMWNPEYWFNAGNDFWSSNSE